MSDEPRTISRQAVLAHRLAVATVLCAVPLVLFGGSVTTIGAGMAVDGWLVAEGHFLLFFPVESWLRDVATFVEHTHRLFGVLVGFAAIGTAVAAWRSAATRTARIMPIAALAAVSLQGLLGGMRVIENDSQLAFLHGVFAQVVLTVLCASALVLSPAWRLTGSSAGNGERSGGGSPERLRHLRGLSVGLVLAVLYQVTTGAWYRHTIRPAVEPGAATLLLTHFAGAVLVAAGTALVITRLRAAQRAGELPGGLRHAPRRLAALLAVQVALGLLSWIGYRPDSVGPLEWGLSIAHVLGGALYLAQCTVVWMWLARLAWAPSAGSVERVASHAGGTR